MALGTVSRPSEVQDFAIGNRKLKMRTVQLTSGANYTTGGETITARSLGFRKIEAAIPAGSARAGTATRELAFEYLANGDVKMLVTTAAAEVAAATNLSTFTARVVFIGY